MAFRPLPVVLVGVSSMILLSFVSSFLPLLLVLLGLFALRLVATSRLPPPPTSRVCFFHPFTNDGGGGERVLWCMVKALQEMASSRDAPAGPALEWAIYSGDEATPASLAARARELFGIELKEEVQVVKLQNRFLLEAATWPQFTLLGQSLGSMVLGAEAALLHPPHVFVDTSGYAFTYPVLKLLTSCRVAAYTHYPTISTDMVQRVQQRTSLYNNSSRVAQSAVLSSLKLLHYRAFALAYGAAGWCADVAMVNSSWTEQHVRTLWRWSSPARIRRVYPPCDTSALQMFPLTRPQSAERFVISVAQFRPEKNHALQLRAFALALQQARQGTDTDAGAGQDGAAQGSLEGVRLKLVGGSRHREDEQRIEMLSSLAASLGIEGTVDFCVNVPFSELRGLLGSATCGLHTMLDEHFGISIVEYMAAGAIAIAHNSGGPRADILKPMEGADGHLLPVGFLATSVEEYADAMLGVLSMGQGERQAMAERARIRAASYSEATFNAAVKEAMSTVMGL